MKKEKKCHSSSIQHNRSNGHLSGKVADEEPVSSRGKRTTCEMNYGKRLKQELLELVEALTRRRPHQNPLLLTVKLSTNQPGQKLLKILTTNRVNLVLGIL